MSISESNIVDGIGLSEDGALVMLITDHLDWENENEHLYTLQNKMNAYISYCESGQYKQFSGDAEVKYSIFEIHFLYEPTETALEFLNNVQEQIGGMGIKIECHISS